MYENSDKYETNGKINDFDFVRFFAEICEKWWIVFICIILSSAIAGVQAYFFEKDVFQASNTIWAFKGVDNSKSKDNNSNQSAVTTVNEINTYNSLINDVSELLKTDYIINKANENLKNSPYEGNERISRSKISISKSSDTRIIKISLTGSSPEFVKYGADILSETLLSNILEFLPLEGMQIIDQAHLPQSQISPNRPFRIIIGFLIGLIIGLSIILLLFILNNKITDPGNFQKRYPHIPILSAIPDFAERDNSRVFRQKKKIIKKHSDKEGQ